MSLEVQQWQGLIIQTLIWLSDFVDTSGRIRKPVLKVVGANVEDVFSFALCNLFDMVVLVFVGISVKRPLRVLGPNSLEKKSFSNCEFLMLSFNAGGCRLHWKGLETASCPFEDQLY